MSARLGAVRKLEKVISPFLYPFTHIPLSNTLHFCPPPLVSKTIKEQLNS